jgi:lincosamide nucleotidyltransferase A/C/D/E
MEYSNGNRRHIRRRSIAEGSTAPVMTAADILEILARLDSAGVSAWLDGGWGVDALLGEQTRAHDDLDLVMALADGEIACQALSDLGYLLHEDERPTRFVLRDPTDRRIDVHTVIFDGEGGGIQVFQDGTPWHYPPDGFSGTGLVADRQVRCLTAEVQLLCHLGYEPDDTDRQDMTRLAAPFGLRLPPPFDA